MTPHDDAMRTLISRADAMRRAVAAWLRRTKETPAGDAFGLWRGRTTDALAYEDALRDEWSGR